MQSGHITTSSGFMFPPEKQSHTSGRMGQTVGSSSVSEINAIILSHSPQVSSYQNQTYGTGFNTALARQQLGSSDVKNFHYASPSGFTLSPSSTQSVMSKIEKIEPLKTPVSLLNEVCAKAKITPQFETEESGPPHDRVFECIVKLERQGMKWEGKGKARAKKDARQEAAKALLVSMDEQVEKLLIPSKSPTDEIDQQKPKYLDCDPDVLGNPVGELNDLCLKIKRQPPEYEDIETEGKPHESIHVVACKLGTQCIEQGRGRTKKHAKKVAAHKVKMHLTEIMLKAAASSKESQEDAKDGTIIEKIQALTLGSQKSTKTKDSFKLGEWFAGFRERSGEKLMALQDPGKTTGTDSTKLLRDIAEEQKFKVEYLDIEKSVPTEEGGESAEEFASIVSIGIEPIAIFLGAGGSKTQARKSAALKAIEFLKIAVKK